MRLLLIDTCGIEGSVALMDTSVSTALIGTEVLPGRSASERLIPVVRSLLEAQHWALRELAAIVVVHGPGSFTGVRVGLSAAKGLCEASGVGLVAVSRLAALASLAEALNGVVHVALDAGRGEFYYGEYAGGHCLREALLTQDEVEAAVGAAPLVVCEERTAAPLSGLDLRRVEEPRAQDALGIAVARVAAAGFDDAAIVDANYLRRTDAQLFARLSTG